MAIKHYQDLDLRKNKLQNVRIDPVQAFPSSPVNGQVVFREDLATFYWYEASSTSWKPLGSTIINATPPSAIDLTQNPSTGAYTIKVKVDSTFFEIDGTQNTLKLKDGAITAVKLAANAVETDKIKDKAATFTKLQDINSMTVIGRTATGAGTPAEVPVDNDPTMAANSATGLTTQAAIVAYVNSKLGTFGGYVGQYNAATSGGLFPVRSGGNLVGNMWDISVAGTIQGIPFEVGDVLIARVNAASNANSADWILLQKNLQDATETIKGYLRLATQAEVNAGTNDTAAVTPLKLAMKLLNPGGRYTTNLGDGTTTQFTVVHNLNAPIPIILLYDNTTNAVVYAGCEVIDPNTVMVTFSSPPAVNRFTIIIKPF